MKNMSEELKIAIEAAKKAGMIQKKYFGGIFEVHDKRASYDRVTNADLESEAAIVEHIRSFYPNHNFLAEENQYSSTDSKYLWIVDPLDGTNNFSCGVPIFASSIALAYENEIVCSVVYNPISDSLFYAQKGQGAFLNGVRIAVNKAKNLKESLLITGFYYDRGAGMQRNLRTVEAFFKSEIIGIRRFGAAALDLCYVACGRAAGFWEFCLHPWDFAAGRLILREAGGKASDNNNDELPVSDKSFVVASNGNIHETMLTIINGDYD